MDLPKTITAGDGAERRDKLAGRTRALENALRALVRDLYLNHFGQPPTQGSIELELRLEVVPGQDWHLRLDPAIKEQLLPQMAGLATPHDVVQAGRVYCFRCRSATCPHSRPSATLEVFQGFDQLGTPTWIELMQYLLDRKVEAVERLYATPACLVTHVEPGRHLRSNQLSAFGRHAQNFTLLAQMTAGYFQIIGADGLEERLALTFQVVASRDRGKRLQLTLNRIIPLAAMEAFELDHQLDWVRSPQSKAELALAQLERKVREMEQARRSRQEINSIMGRIPGVLQKLAAALEQEERKQRRRTHHAQERKAILRPVDKAMADLTRARLERTFWDTKTKAFAITAERGRCHIFNPEGRHVTSFVIQADAVQQRLRKKRWRPVSPEEFQAFMASFQSTQNETN